MASRVWRPFAVVELSSAQDASARTGARQFVADDRVRRPPRDRRLRSTSTRCRCRATCTPDLRWRCSAGAGRERAAAEAADDASSRVTRGGRGAPCARVLWKCAPRGGHRAPVRSLRRRGVRCRWCRRCAGRAIGRAMSTPLRRWPSNGQSHAVAMMTSPPRSRARSRRRSGGRRAADVPVAVGRRHASIDQSGERRRRGTGARRGSSAASAAASASAGTFDGDTNAVASTSRTPVATTASSSSSLADKGIGSSICRPSRRHTSRMVTWSGSAVIAPPPRSVSSSSADLPSSSPYTSSLCCPGRPNPRCGWFRASRSTPE